jgi:hypothetical protein
MKRELARLMSIAALVLAGTGCQNDGAQEPGADGLPDRGPVGQLSMLLHGMHVGACDPQLQQPAYHYCSMLSEDLTQCVLFDGAGRSARLIGTEHIVSRRRFDALPPEEQVYWHPHTYEVKSGLLTAPGMPEAAEHELMEVIISTYGKTWHTWHMMREMQPVGSARLMKAFTADGQIRPELIAMKEQELQIRIEEKRRNRADIPDPGYNQLVLPAPVQVDAGCQVRALEAPWRDLPPP